MPDAAFDLAGCRVRFNSSAPGLADWISSDFSCFPSHPGEGEIRVAAALAAPERAALPPVLLRTRHWGILAAPPGRRTVWYPEGAVCRVDYAAGTAFVESADPELLKELSYLLILSRAGEALDRRGLHRIHAGALEHRGQALLFCGRQGAGKSTLLLELLKDPSFALISDDTPLVSRGGLVYPFPARVGLLDSSPHLRRFPEARRLTRRRYGRKHLIHPRAAGRVAAGPVPPGAIFLLSKGPAPRIRRASPASGAAELAVSLAAGWGVPQLAEYFIRPSPADAAAKARILASRLGAAGSLLRSSDFWTFETGPDPAQNADAFRTFLRNNSGPGSAS